MRKMYVDCYEPQKIISDASMTLGDYDFVFEWTDKPSMKKIKNLIERIDDKLSDLGCYYTLNTG